MSGCSKVLIRCEGAARAPVFYRALVNKRQKKPLDPLHAASEGAAVTLRAFGVEKTLPRELPHYLGQEMREQKRRDPSYPKLSTETGIWG